MTTGVLIIDMQDFFMERMYDRDKEIIIPAQQKLLKHCIANDVPVVVVEFERYGNTIDQIAELVRKAPRFSFVTKPFNNGFLHSPLEGVLNTYGVDHLLLAGVNASACVRFTANSIPNQISWATSDDLIADSISMQEKGMWGKSASWYAENGIFASKVEELLYGGVIPASLYRSDPSPRNI